MNYRVILVTKNDVKEIYSDLNFDSLYKMIECKLVELLCRKIGDIYFDIICDEAGLLKPDYFVSAANSKNCIMLVGNLVLTTHDNQGEPRDLTDEEVSVIMDNVIEKHESNRKVIRMEY